MYPMYEITPEQDTQILFISFDSAVAHLVAQLDSLPEEVDPVAVQDLRTELAILYLSRSYYLEALNLFDEAIDYYRAFDRHNAAGLEYAFVANVYLTIGDEDLAMAGILRADSLIDVSDSMEFAREIVLNTTSSMHRNGVRVGTVPMDTLASELTAALNEPGYDGLAMLNAGAYFLHRGEPFKALYFLNIARASEPDDGAILRDTYKHLAIASQQTGDIERAYKYLEQYSYVNDSLLNDRRQRILNRLLVQMRLYDKQAEIRDLEKDKYIEAVKNRGRSILSISLLIGSIIILFGAYLAIRNYQKRLSANQIIHKQNEEINQRRITELENNLKIKSMHSMIMGQEAERERVAKDLHDSLGGLLSTVKLHFDALQSQVSGISKTAEYEKAYGLLDEACREVRSISNNMQPGALLKLGLVPAIKDLVNRVQSEETPTIDFQHFGVNGEMSQTSRLNIYRIIQELLNNSLKHAKASHILIQLIQKDDEFIVMVEDDGVGYNPAQVKTGMGTGNIASRVDFLKGELSVQSKEGDGTTTLINFPVSEN